MALGREIVLLAASVAVLVAFVACSPTPGGHKKETYRIHVPIKYHTIHHVKVEKVPIHIKKHIHHHKYEDHEHKGHDGYDRYDDLYGGLSHSYEGGLTGFDTYEAWD